MERSSSPKNYHRFKTALQLLRFLALMVFFFLWARFFSHKLAQFCQSHTSNIFSGRLLYLVIMTNAFYVFIFPFSWLDEFYLEKRFGLSRQKFSAWLKDFCKDYLLNLVLFVFMGEVLYFFLNAVSFWQLAVWGVWFLLSVILANLAPYVIIPLFYQMSPLPEGELKSKLFSLAQKAQVKLSEIYKVLFSQKTVKLNAFVSGWGKKRRLVLADTLLAELSDEEIAAVFGHELGHIKKHDIWRMIFLSGAVSLASFFLGGIFWHKLCLYFSLSPQSIESLPLFLAAIILAFLLFLPGQNFILRRWEEAADGYSCYLTNPTDLSQALEKLGRINLAEFKLAAWKKIFFATHPPLAERIERIRSYGKN